MKKAKFYASYVDGLEYEYRGRKYTINPHLYTPTAWQHRTAQANIDAAIAREEERMAYYATHATRYEETPEYAMDMFWEYVNS